MGVKQVKGVVEDVLFPEVIYLLMLYQKKVRFPDPLADRSDFFKPGGDPVYTKRLHFGLQIHQKQDTSIL